MSVTKRFGAPSPVFDTYWKFAAERQEIFHRRFQEAAKPWTSDAILKEYKFTNVYRAADRVSQYLIRNVIYREDLPKTIQEVFFRILLFKVFNKIETWEMLEGAVGAITFSEFDFAKYDIALANARSRGQAVYSAAYIMPSGGSKSTEHVKHRIHLRLIERMVREDLPKKLSESESLKNSFELLKSYPTIGDFLAYQFAIDLNYSEVTNFSEMEFVVAGPGARDGMRKCFPKHEDRDSSEIIRYMTDTQEEQFKRLGIKFKDLWGRRLHLIDCQNVFCEVDKYARVAFPEISGVTGRTRIKQRYKQNTHPMDYWFPPKWGVKCERRSASQGSLLWEMTSKKEGNMNFDDYQDKAAKTTQKIHATGVPDPIVPLLGLAGETGELLNEYKKLLRDGPSHLRFEERLQEELGDVLWYVSEIATKFKLRLTEIASQNLQKTAARFGNKEDALLWSTPRIYDKGFPESQRFARHFVAEFRQISVSGKKRIQVLVNGKPMGQELTDNAHAEDGYRFHDVFHLACVAVLGWSPVTRRNLEKKRRDNPKIDEVEDGGRAIVTEEGVSALVFAYATDHAAMKGIRSIDYDILKAIKIMTAKLEVSVCTTGEWERAILMGYDVWRKVEKHEGGKVIVDLDHRLLAFSSPEWD